MAASLTLPKTFDNKNAINCIKTQLMHLVCSMELMQTNQLRIKSLLSNLSSDISSINNKYLHIHKDAIIICGDKIYFTYDDKHISSAASRKSIRLYSYSKDGQRIIEEVGFIYQHIYAQATLRSLVCELSSGKYYKFQYKSNCAQVVLDDHGDYHNDFYPLPESGSFVLINNMKFNIKIIDEIINDNSLSEIKEAIKDSVPYNRYIALKNEHNE
jgi:hypothetical protein